MLGRQLVLVAKKVQCKMKADDLKMIDSRHFHCGEGDATKCRQKIILLPKRSDKRHARASTAERRSGGFADAEKGMETWIECGRDNRLGSVLAIGVRFPTK